MGRQRTAGLGTSWVWLSQQSASWGPTTALSRGSKPVLQDVTSAAGTQPKCIGRSPMVPPERGVDDECPTARLAERYTSRPREEAERGCRWTEHERRGHPPRNESGYSSRSQDLGERIIVDTLGFLQDWFSGQCDRSWEHQLGIEIKTIDNPGWHVRVDLVGTSQAGVALETVEVSRSEDDWYLCRVNDDVFEGFGGPRNLGDVLVVFLSWAEVTRIEKNPSESGRSSVD